MVASTLEWLADHCIDLGVYTVTAALPRKGQTNSSDVTFQLNRTLRGKPVARFEDLYYAVSRPPKVKLPIVQVGDEFLVCFQHYRTGEKRSVQRISLSKPQTVGYPHIAVTSKLKILKNGKQILKVFEGRLKQRRKVDAVRIDDYSKDNRFELEPQMQPYYVIYSGSSCYLRIPKDLLPPK